MRWINWVFEVAGLANQHTFIVLTKRPERALEFHKFIEFENIDSYGKIGTSNWEWPSNVWFLFTAENQEWLDKRAPIALQIPAPLIGLSYEPALGPLDLDYYIKDKQVRPCEELTERMVEDGYSFGKVPRIGLVICGGESGPGARPMHPDCPRQARDQCIEAGISFNFKQWGAYIGGFSSKKFNGHPDWLSYQNETLSPNFDFNWGGGFVSLKVGSKAAGRLLDGKIWDQWPEVK